MLKRSPGQPLIIEWMTVTTTGLLICLALFFVVTENVITENDAPKVNFFLIIIMPLWPAITQWVVLQRYISTAWLWIVVTVLGVYAAIPTIVFVYSSTIWISYNRAGYTPAQNPSLRLPMTWEASIIATLVGGVVLGFFQWFVLSQHTNRAGWWIVLNGLVWGVSSSWITEVAVHFLMRGARNYNSPYPYDYDITREMVVQLIILITPIVGAIKGSMLVWLFKSPKNN